MLIAQYIKNISFCCLIIFSSLPQVLSAQPRSSWDDGRLVRLSILVLVRNGGGQTFLHGAQVSISPLSSSDRQVFDFPRRAMTGGGGVAHLGALPPSVMVGNYRIVVSHPDCGTIEKRSYSHPQSPRPQTLSIAFTGACGY